MSEDLHLLAGAYALDAVDELERARFERHLEGCSTCAGDVAEFREATAALASLSSTPPPADLRSRVLEAADRARQASPITTTARTPPAEARTRSRPALVVLGLAAAVTVLAGVAGAGWWRAERHQDDLEEIIAIVSAPDSSTITFEGSSGLLRATHSPSRAKLLLIGSDLPDPGEEATYQLWLVRSTGPLSAGLFTPDDGTVEAVLTMAGTPASDEFLAVTIEPAGGSAQPTSDPIFVQA